MTFFDDIYERAVNSYRLITSAETKKLGMAHGIEL